MLKLCIYGYLNRIRSSRRLMAECRRNVELFYPPGMAKPNFRTIAKYRGYQQQLWQTGESQILETDPERRSMLTKEGMLLCYNIQTVADDDSHIIVSFETTAADTGQGLLSKMAEQIREELHIETAAFKADKG